MTLAPDSPAGPASTAGPRAVLVHSATPPEFPAIAYVDVRPGPVATFDGDRVGLSLSVTAGGVETHLDWTDFAGLDAAVAGALHRGPGAAVRFGDRAACRSALGPARLRAVERWLVATVRREGAALVAWTSAPSRTADGRSSDAGVGSRARFD